MPNRIVNTQFWKKAALNLKSPTFNAGKIMLNIANVTPTYATTLANLTETTDTGYARLTPTWAAAGNYATGDAQMLASVLTWNFTFSAGGFTIYSVHQLDAATNLLWSYKLDTPVTITAAGPWQFLPSYADGDY